MHTTINIKHFDLSFSDTLCIHDFSTNIYPGARIALIGRNGSGKSSLLKRLASMGIEDESIHIPDDCHVGYVEQTIDTHPTLSGGQRFQKQFSAAMADQPNVLLLDEPTNHLDAHNRTQLMAMLQRYRGTLIIASHDRELIHTCTNTLWHIDQQQVHIFTGTYDDYMAKLGIQRMQIDQQLNKLKQAEKARHNALMKEQMRAKKSRILGEKKYAHDTIARKGKQGQGQRTQNRNNKALNLEKFHLQTQRNNLYQPQIIKPTFSLDADMQCGSTLLSVHDGSVAYTHQPPILRHISITLMRQERMVLLGNNASGKSTLLKALCQCPNIQTTGTWHLPDSAHIGYFDQHYTCLTGHQSAIEHLRAVQPTWQAQRIRSHLQTFLFRSNTEVNTPTHRLSGGEKARLALSMIAAKPPRLLILDEVNNNLDWESKQHVIQVLSIYPGAMLMVSHESDFIKAIGADHTLCIEDGLLRVW